MNYLDYFILFSSCIAEIYLCNLFFAGFLDKRNFKHNTFTSSVLFILFTMLLYLINLQGDSKLNLWIVPILLFIYLFISFKTKIVQGTMYFICVYSILIGSEFLFVVFAETTRKDSGIALSSMPWLTLEVKLLSFLLILIVQQVFGGKSKKMTSRIFWMYLFLPVSSLGMMFITYYINITLLDRVYIKVALTITFAFMLLSNIIVFVAFNRYAETLHRSMQQEWIITTEKMNRQYYQKISELNDCRDILVHDLKHHVTAVCAAIQSGESNEALKMLRKLGTELVSNERNVYSKIPFLDIILTEKQAYALQCNVSFNIEVDPDIFFDNIEKSDYAVMLGNLLDNAIQAASYTGQPHVDVNIFMVNRGAFLVSKIRNSFVKENLLINGDEFITTKKGSGIHGIGIKSVNKTTARCGGIFTTNVRDNEFIAVLSLPTGDFGVCKS